MQISAAGSRNHDRAGFTLLELLVVMALVAMASVGVGWAVRDASQMQLDREAQRLAALLESARARSRLTGVPVRWRASASGFRFEGLDAAELPGQWLDPETSVADAAPLLLGPEPIIEPQAVVLVSRRQAGRSVRLVTDGVRPFAVQPATP